jgi:hypothetical protein
MQYKIETAKLLQSQPDSYLNLKYQTLQQIKEAEQEKEFRDYENARINGPVLLPIQTKAEYLQTKAKYDYYVKMQTPKLIQLHLEIPTYIDYMRMQYQIETAKLLQSQPDSYLNYQTMKK